MKLSVEKAINISKLIKQYQNLTEGNSQEGQAKILAKYPEVVIYQRGSLSTSQIEKMIGNLDQTNPNYETKKDFLELAKLKSELKIQKAKAVSVPAEKAEYHNQIKESEERLNENFTSLVESLTFMDSDLIEMSKNASNVELDEVMEVLKEIDKELPELNLLEDYETVTAKLRDLKLVNPFFRG